MTEDLLAYSVVMVTAVLCLMVVVLGFPAWAFLVIAGCVGLAAAVAALG